MAVTERNGIEGKICSSGIKCKRQWKPLTDFYKDSSKGPSQGFRHCRCKECYKEGRRRLDY